MSLFRYGPTLTKTSFISFAVSRVDDLHMSIISLMPFDAMLFTSISSIDSEIVSITVFLAYSL